VTLNPLSGPETRPAAKPLGEVRDPFAPAPAGGAASGAQAPAQSTRRASGDELISDLFHDMHELDFCADSREAATFTLALAMGKLGAFAGVVHLYDIDQREFVVVDAAGPGATILRGLRTADTDPLAAEALRTRGAVIVLDATSDPRVAGQRWAALRNAVGQPLAAIASARAAQAGRFLGLIELAHAAGASAFEAGDEHALSYIAERFTEFVAAHGVMLDEDG
jgi:GAF domain-containing protein